MAKLHDDMKAGTDAATVTSVEVKQVIQAIAKPDIKHMALVTPDNYFGMEEWYLPVVECPKCKHKVPAKSNFCSACGIGLKLSTTVKKLANPW